MDKGFLRMKRRSNIIYSSIFSLFIFILFTILFFYFNNDIYAQKLTDSISLKANAGENQNIEEGQPVILNAEDSLSSDAPIDAYLWRQVDPKTPSIDLENSNTSRASFIAPNLPNDQYFVFQLIVKDKNITDTDTVNIFVTEDLSAIAGAPGHDPYEPERCFDGKDNDLDGKIDLQDEECGQSGQSSLPSLNPDQYMQQAPPQQQEQINPQPLPQLPHPPDQQQGLPRQQQEQLPQQLPGQQQERGPFPQQRPPR